MSDDILEQVPMGHLVDPSLLPPSDASLLLLPTMAFKRVKGRHGRTMWQKVPRPDRAGSDQAENQGQFQDADTA